MSVPWKKHGVKRYKPEKACAGYTIISPFTSKDVWLIDMSGNYVQRWIMPTIPRNHGTLLPNGHLLYTTTRSVMPPSEMAYPRVSWGLSDGLIEVDWDGNQVWKYVDIYQHHTFCRMENGNTMIPRLIRLPEEIAHRLKGGMEGTEDRGMIWIDGFREVTPDGKIVWEWSIADHLDPGIHVLCPLAYRGDGTHMNSCVVLRDGNVLTSLRNIDTICIIDKVTGNIKWQWGPGEISHPHDPSLLENGNILLFDNGAHRRDGSLFCYSRGVEVNPATNKIEWEYKASPPQSFYSALISGCQRLPNGNTLICEGLRGRVFEVTVDGEIVWEYVNPFYAPWTGGSQGVSGGAKEGMDVPEYIWPFSNALFRAYRYMPDYSGLKGKDLDPDKLEHINILYGPKAFGS